MQKSLDTTTKLLIGQALLVFAIVIGGVWGAAGLGHRPRLGAPWFEALGLPAHNPWRLFEWWYAYEPYAPGLFRRPGMMKGSRDQGL